MADHSEPGAPDNDERRYDVDELRYVTEHDPEDGTWIEAQLTDEGVIVDLYSQENGLLATFAQTYDELVRYTD